MLQFIYFMKLLIITLFLMIFQEPGFIKGKNYRGYIFNETQFVLLSVKNQKNRYTPSEKDILLTEKLIYANLENVNKKLENQIDGCPVIHKKLNKYVRQYIGFINNKGQRIVWINFIWDKSIVDERLKEDVIRVLDGCSYYWNIEVNLDEGTLYNLSVNGFG